MKVEFEFKKKENIIIQTGLTFYKDGNKSQLVGLEDYNDEKYKLIREFLK